MSYIYRNIARIIPPKSLEKLKQLLLYSTIRVHSESFIGFVTLSSLLLGLILGFLLGPLWGNYFWIFFVGGTVLLNFITYFWLITLTDKKAQLIEEALPDALQLMTSNLRAGMTPDKALLLSARPEFGPLKDEIEIIGRKVTLGRNVGLALIEMGDRVRSRRLTRAVQLINSGLESGGSLATLLEATSNDLREQLLVDKRIKANVTMYFIFIFSAAAVVTPLLFGLSSYLIEVLRTTFSQIDIPSTAAASMPITIGKISITEKFLTFFIITFLLTNCLMASLLLGMISKGRKREGLKYYLPMILLAIPLFLLARWAISSLLSGLFII